jgi:aspartate/methionine/tyrosine aminotransferase
MKISARGQVDPFLILEAFREAKALERGGRDMVHLSLGQPGKEAPPEVLSGLGKLLHEQPLGYTESSGWLPLRERIVQFYRQRYGIAVPLERVFITVGSSSAFMMAMTAAFDAGDKIAIIRPCYPAYPNMMKALDLEPVFLRGRRVNKFQPNVAMLEALPKKPAGLVIASPSNPTGTIIAEEELKQLSRYCEEKGIRLISDEIYHGVTYGAKTQTVAALLSKGIVVNSFSKYFLLPGWRLGWTVMAEDLVDSFSALCQNFFISPPSISQYAALECFNHLDVLDGVVDEYRVNRDILLNALPKIGFDELAPAEGAFYIYAEISKLANDSTEFCRRMMHECGVVAVPGVDFDRENGHRFIRFSFSASRDRIEEAVKRLGRWLS